jgi:hypothetical protein
MSQNPNQQHLIAVFRGNDRERAEVYLLNPGDAFQGFGGSRQAHVVRKTASLIVRAVSPWGMKDTEYNLADKRQWETIFQYVKQYDIETFGGADGVVKED